MSKYLQTLNKYKNNYDIFLIDTDNLYYEVQAYDNYGREYDFTNYILGKMEVRNDRNEIINTLTTEDGSIILNYDNITGKILMNKDGFDIEGTFDYNLRVVNEINNIYTIMNGKFIVEKNITVI